MIDTQQIRDKNNYPSIKSLSGNSDAKEKLIEKTPSEYSFDIDNFIEQHENSTLILKHLFGNTLINMIYGISMISFYITIIPYMKIFNMDSLSISILSNCFFLGAFISPFYINAWEKVTSKKLLIAFHCLFLFLIQIWESFNTSLMNLYIIRVLVGISANVVYCESCAILVEYLPSYYRGILFNLPSFGMRISPLFTLLLFYVFDPSLNPNIQTILIISSIIHLIGFFTFFFSIENGPRNLIINRRYDEAHVLLNQLAKVPVSEVKFTRIINEIHLANHHELDSENEVPSFASILKNKKILWLSFLIALSKFASSMVSSGWPLAIAIFLDKDLFITDDDQASKIGHLTVISLSMLFQPLVSFISEVPTLGRLGSLRLSALLFFVFCLFLFWVQNKYFYFIIGISLLFCQTNSSLLFSYTNEVFPTKYRNQANYIVSTSDAVACIVANFVFVNLAIQSVDNTIIFSAILCGINLGICLILKIETLNQRIDSFIELKN